jgi:membrane-associated phospholipid phosphatase
MDQSRLKTPYALAAIYLVLTLIIGTLVILLPFSGMEWIILSHLRNFAQNTIGLEAFQILTYLGDFYLWIVLASIYLVYAYFKSRKQFGAAIELAIFLVITTALTYSIKVVFVRPRPDCLGLSVYDDDFVSSFSYPSGHVSRATGTFSILSRESRTRELLAVIAVFLVSLSRMILGAHYLTDVVGGVFLSLAAQRLANLSLSFLTHTEFWRKRFSAILMDSS